MMNKIADNQIDEGQKRSEQREIEIGILRDAYFQLEKAVIERKKAEEDVRASEKKFRNLFETANDMIQSVKPDGDLVDVNPAWCQTLGYTKQEGLTMNLMDIIHPESQAHCMDLFKKVISGERVNSIEAKFVTKNGEIIIVNGDASCIFKDGKPDVTWGVFRNVTEHEKIDQMKDEFVNIAAHDLRTPATLIKDYISRVLDGDAGEISDKARQMLSEAYEGNERSIRLVNDFLSVSRLERGKVKVKPELADLREIIEELMPSLSAKALAKDITIEYKAAKLPKVLADTERTIQVINNLVGNAIKFTQKGKITISHEVKNEVSAQGSNSKEEPAGGFVITHITDTGIGIDEEGQKHLFEKYYRKSETTGEIGLGLGLYICQMIIKNSKGKIWAKSKEGKGSTFSFSLPITK